MLNQGAINYTEEKSMKSSSLSRRSMWIFSLIVMAALMLAACQPAATPAAPTVAPTDVPVVEPTAEPTMAPTEAAVMEEPTINVAEDPNLGQILVDGKGMTLYMFTKDEADKSNCEGGCLTAWPPLVTSGSAVAGEGVDQAMIGTAELPDGRMIVTYNHMPLYYWQKDTKPGDVTGQDVNQVWYVVSPAGEVVREAGSVPATGDDAQTDVTINVAEDPNLGQILVDGEGMTLYMFTKDEADKSNCEGGCLTAWPPLVTASSAKAGEGVDQAMIGTADLPDGRKIVTYNHMPLYYWQKDTKPGDTTGQDVNQVWYVVGPDGEPIMEAPASGGATDSDDVKVMVADHATLGKILVDAKGMTLYMFTKDEPNKVNCSGGCLTAWPPFVAEGEVKAEDGVDQAMLGTADLADGKKIVTYNQMPLYYWAGDTKPGDATGQDVNQVWYVVAPDGNPVGAP